MRSSQVKPISEAINAYLKAMRLDGKLKEIRLINTWEDLMGLEIAKQTEDLYIKNRILFIRLRSAALRQELSMQRTRIVKALNAKVGEAVVDEIIFK